MGSLDLTGWIGVAGPAGLTPEAAAWWSGQLTATLREPAVQERLRAIGMEPDLIVGEPLQQFVRPVRSLGPADPRRRHSA